MGAIRVRRVKKIATGGVAAMLRAGSAAIEARLCGACLETMPQGIRSLKHDGNSLKIAPGQLGKPRSAARTAQARRSIHSSHLPRNE
jgi:hypothetical protein